MYSNYTQYFIITHKGKESEKNIYIYIHVHVVVVESLCCIPETNITL